jgi:hypothetical protein
MKPEGEALELPRLRKLLNPIAPRIASLTLRSDKDGHKAVLRFTNGYGVEIFQHRNDDFFDMAVIRFHGSGYEFAFDTSVPDLNLGYCDADIFNLCSDISMLKQS